MELKRKEEILSAIYHCVKCKLCSIASFHPNAEWLPLCPSGQYYGYQAFYAPGKMEIFRAVLEGEITEPSEGLLKSVYACTVCGACYEKCKQITSVELGAPELFEEMRSELASKGWILDAHKSITERIKETKNPYGERYEYKVNEETTDGNANVLYYIGCTARYRVPEIADAMGTGSTWPFDGATWPWMIDDGILAVCQNHGYGGFSAINDYSMEWVEVKNAVNSQRPFVISIFHGGTGSGYSQPYGDHSVTCAGYSEFSTPFVNVWDTWDIYSTHYIAYGNWWGAMSTWVNP